MSSNDPSSDLDARIAAIVESSVGRMRDELLHRMQDTESRLRDITGRIGGEAAAALVAEPVTEPAPVEPAAPAADASSDLFDAVAAMDRGSSQQEVLAALLEGTGRFAGRSALFLTRSDGAQGWGSYGFEETASDIQQVVLSYGEGPLAVLSEGRGCVVLTAGDCADLCDWMGATPGTEGLLIPFVLRDRLAAALYVDRAAADPPLARRSLQLLAYIGAQAVEGLALRKRGETPTLQVATDDAETPGVALWEAPAPEPETAPVAPVEEPPAAEPAMTEPVVSEPRLTEPQVTETVETIEAPPSEMTIEEVIEEPAAPEMEAEAAPEMEAEAAPEMEAEIEVVTDDDWTMPAAPMDEPVAPMDEPVAPMDEPVAAMDEPVEAPPVAPVEGPAPPLEAPAEPGPDATVEEAPPWAATAGADLSGIEAEPEPPAAEIPMPPAAVGETTEVSPPTDVSGPGWAFTASRAAAEVGDDAQHEEARRLARLLVTEIKLYNEEQVEEGRRGNDIYARLKEDIDRSRQIFNERVDDGVRQETDYFHEEMVRILAGGNAEALGI